MQYLVARELGPENWSVFEKMCLKQKKVKEDRRAETSPLNGLKGGRPSMPVTEYAERFLQLYSENGESRLHFWNNRCWHFIDGIWKEITNDELTIRITNFLQQQSVHHEGRIGTGLISDVITNLKGLCGLTNVNMPCWLPDGSDANDVACFSNGLLSIDKLTKGEVQTLQPVTPRYFGQNQVGYAYIPGADCPQWHQYLETTFDDEDSRAILQMMFGYIISGKLDKNVGFFLVGRGGDGKSVAAHVLRKLVGENQTCCLPFANLGDKFSSYLLTEHRLNLVEELPVTAEIRNIADAEKIFKMVTDGAVIPVEQKFQSPQEKQASARCVFLANELPQFVDRSNGLWDRLIVLPFTHRFRDTDSEKANLKYDLEAELPGIFNWAIEGARRLAGCRRFPILQASREFLEKHRLACDHEASFLNEAVHPEDTGRTAKIVLYKCYRRWMEDHGYKPFGMDKFNAAVKVAFPNAREHRERVPNDRIIWTGIELNTTYYSEY